MKKLFAIAAILVAGFSVSAQYPVYRPVYNVNYRTVPVQPMYVPYTTPMAYNFYFGNGLPVAPLHIFLYTW